MRILLADDHPLFLDGLKGVLALRGIDVVGTARDGVEAVEKARALKPDVILMDIQMPVLDGVTATRMIKAEQPNAKVVMLTMSESDEDLFAAIRSGASGYLLKAEDTDTFFELLSGLARGEAPLSPGLARRILQEFSGQAKTGGAAEPPAVHDARLTPREVEVLTLVALGLTYKEVGAKLALSERTIKYHMGEIIARLHLANRREAIEYARRMAPKSTTGPDA